MTLSATAGGRLAQYSPDRRTPTLWHLSTRP